MWIDEQILAKKNSALAVECFYPPKRQVVCGRSNKAETEVNIEACKEDGIEVSHRKGGGGTVLLSPQSLVISIGTYVVNYYDNKSYFNGINQTIIDAFAEFYPIFKQLELAGISDITFKGKKIAGTSMFRSRHYLLFQASILMNADFEEIAKYLRHPSIEPEYRQKRSHKEFLINATEIHKSAMGLDLVQLQKNIFSDIKTEKYFKLHPPQ